jgi:hypothetical protein
MKEHECAGPVYYKRCNGCATRLLLTTTPKSKQEAAMLGYLSRYHGHSIDELAIDLEIARSVGPRKTA